jgi:hypothetical protein
LGGNGALPLAHGGLRFVVEGASGSHQRGFSHRLGQLPFFG